jgi:hypothetical protein
MRFLRGLGGRVLSCGCLVGVYETYGSGVVATIDACGPACNQPTHRLHGIVELDPEPVTSGSPETSGASGRV